MPRFRMITLAGVDSGAGHTFPRLWIVSHTERREVGVFDDTGFLGLIDPTDGVDGWWPRSEMKLAASERVDTLLRSMMDDYKYDGIGWSGSIERYIPTFLGGEVELFDPDAPSQIARWIFGEEV